VWVVVGMAALGLPLLAKVVWPNIDLQPFVLLPRYESSGRRCSATAPARGVGRGLSELACSPRGSARRYRDEGEDVDCPHSKPMPRARTMSTPTWLHSHP
jgi:hypothetical protein